MLCRYTLWVPTRAVGKHGEYVHLNADLSVQRQTLEAMGVKYEEKTRVNSEGVLQRALFVDRAELSQGSWEATT